MYMVHPIRRAALVLGLLAAGLPAASCGEDSAEKRPGAQAAGLTPETAARVVALHNAGIASLERYDYAPAVESLRKSHDLAPSCGGPPVAGAGDAGCIIH